MQKVFFLTIILLISSCSSIPGYDQKCSVKKLTFDIGSGSTKYYYAQVNRCSRSVIHIFNQGHFRFPFKQHLIQSKNNRFSAKIQKEFLDKLTVIIKQHPAETIQSVATSAFRTSDNGEEFAQFIREKTGMSLKIISQKTEGLLGYKAVRAKSKQNDKFLYWDIGGGSMQMIIENSTVPMIYKGKIGAASFKSKVLTQIFKGKRQSPNPLGVKNISKAIQISKTFAKNSIPKGFYSLAQKLNTIGIGGVHQYSILKKHTDKNYYTKKQLIKWLNQGASQNDRQIGGDFSQTDITNLALVLGYMDYLKINRVNVVKGINMAYALLYNWQPLESL
jgi:exopolyphosphatase/guanosine-5'-triphosphate,3'-diphosphate pyrophosphatase